tara:strand:- start:53 stop:1624 length:1572 start_codon:yes stop_codon:yes gene_type:complete
MKKPAPSGKDTLALLAEFNLALSASSNVRVGIQQAIEILLQRSLLTQVLIILKDIETGKLEISLAEGLRDEEQHETLKNLEKIIVQVIQSECPVVIPQVSQDPIFSENTENNQDNKACYTSFICVPIPGPRAPIGAVTIDLPFEKDRDYDEATLFFRVIANMLGQAFRLKDASEAIVSALNGLTAVERQKLVQENTNLKAKLKERYDFSNIIGTSGPMRKVYEQIAQVASSNTTVLVRGESGTGKELIANALHYNSPRAKQSLLKISCAALPDSLIEAELFGHEKGAFTGANTRKKGRFELADGGTLFLDEVGDINLSTQVKLLRVIQEKEFERLGGTTSIKSNVRLIAATNTDLEKAIAGGTFREDLHYRLNVFSIFVPPLRDRKTDILLLADHFLEKYAIEHGKNIKRISTPAIDMLMTYHWPGNVRELQNIIERAVLVCDANVIHGHHLPPTLQTSETSGTVDDMSLVESVNAYEKDLIQDALKTTRGNRVKAAKLLNSTERIIGYKIKKHEIDCRRFRT